MFLVNVLICCTYRIVSNNSGTELFIYWKFMDVSSIRSKNTIILSNSIKYITKTIISDQIIKLLLAWKSFLSSRFISILHPYNIISVKKEKKITTFDLPAGVVSENKRIPLFSVNFRFTQQQESSTIFTRTYTRLVIPVRGSNLLENDRIGWWGGKKFLCKHTLRRKTRGRRIPRNDSRAERRSKEWKARL